MRILGFWIFLLFSLTTNAQTYDETIQLEQKTEQLRQKLQAESEKLPWLSPQQAEQLAKSLINDQSGELSELSEDQLIKLLAISRKTSSIIQSLELWSAKNTRSIVAISEGFVVAAAILAAEWGFSQYTSMWAASAFTLGATGVVLAGLLVPVHSAKAFDRKRRQRAIEKAFGKSALQGSACWQNLKNIL